MPKRTGLYTFLREHINYDSFPDDIVAAADSLARTASKAGFTTSTKNVQHFLYKERARLKTGKPRPTRLVAREDQVRPRVNLPGATTAEPGGPLAEALKTLDMAIGMLGTVRKSLVLHSQFQTDLKKFMQTFGS